MKNIKNAPFHSPTEPQTSPRTRTTPATLPRDESEPSLGATSKAVPRGDIRCPWCNTTDNQLVAHFTEGEEYMERRAWCSQCGIWRIIDFAMKDRCFPFARNIETAAEKAELDLAFEALQLDTMLEGIDPEECIDRHGGHSWRTNPFRPSRAQ